MRGLESGTNMEKDLLQRFAREHRIEGNPDPKHVSTSFVRAQQSFDAHGQSPHDAPNECLFEEGREPRAYDGDLFHALQFRVHPSNT